MCVDFSHPTSSSTSPPKTVDEEVTFCCWCVSPRTISRQLRRNIHRETKMNYACGLIMAEMIFNKATSTPYYYHHVLIIPNPSTTSFFFIIIIFFFVFISFSFLLLFYSILILFRASMEKHERLSGLCLWLIRLFIYKIKVGIYTV